MRLLLVTPCTIACPSFLLSRELHSQRHIPPNLIRSRDVANTKSQRRQSIDTLAAAATAGNYGLDPPVTREQLTDPAHIGAAASVERRTRNRGGDLSLNAYLNLPVSQYSRLDPDMIKPLGDGNYALQVPRVQLFSVWVEPLVHVTVADDTDSAGRSCVSIRAVNWGLSGSPLIESFGLARRFSLDFCTLLTWAPNTEGQAGSDDSTGILKGQTTLDVYTEVIGPFRFMPRQVLETGGNAVMQTLNNALLPVFMTRLCDDYERWASEPKFNQDQQS